MTNNEIKAALEDIVECAQNWISEDDRHIAPLPDNWIEAIAAIQVMLEGVE